VVSAAIKPEYQCYRPLTLSYCRAIRLARGDGALTSNPSQGKDDNSRENAENDDDDKEFYQGKTRLVHLSAALRP